MTKLEWNLQGIFANNQSFYDEITNVKRLLEDIKKYEATELDSTLLLNLLDKKWKIKEISNNILIYGSLMYYKNVNDDECIELKRVAETFNNDVNTILKFIDRKILDLGFEKVSSFIVENPKLEIYKLSLYNLFRLEEHIQSDEINQKIKENNDCINEQLSIYNNLGLIQKYLKIKSDLLEIEEPHLYDFGVPLDSNLKIKYSLEEAKEIILKALEPLGQEYIEVVKTLFDGHIDAELNENKHQSITFSWHTYSFMNFRGTYIDLKNMIHEIGHIVNYYLSKKEQPFIYEDSTIFVGETASIVNEILLNRYLYKNANTEEEKIFYLSKEIENYFSSVFKQTMYTEFENDLYKIRTNSELTSEILCERYFNILKKYYGNNITYDEIANTEWTRLGHLYRWSYYPYKYATGLLMASVVVDSLVDKKSLSKEDYIKFLSAGSSQYSLDLLKILNIDLINTNIIESGFNVMAEDIKELQKVLYLNKK